jgi:hypothetical protein
MSTESFDSLWSYCTANDRVVPVPYRWNELYERLNDKRQLPSGGWEPAAPLILGAWWGTPPAFKQLRFREHVEWACNHGQLSEVATFIRALPEKEWFHLRESKGNS